MQKTIFLIIIALICFSAFAAPAPESPTVDFTAVNTSEEKTMCYAFFRYKGGPGGELTPLELTGCVEAKKRVTVNVDERQFLVSFHWLPKQEDHVDMLVSTFDDHIETTGPIRARHHKTGLKGYKLTVFPEDYF